VRGEGSGGVAVDAYVRVPGMVAVRVPAVMESRSSLAHLPWWG